MTAAPMYDVIICGAGPAGLAAAGVLLNAGATVAIIDEQPRAGGQFLRQPPKSFQVANWLPSNLYATAKAKLHDVENAPEAQWLFETTIHGLFAERDENGGPFYRLWASNADDMVDVRSRHVIIATGCYDLPVAFPGWTLPGVMSVGGMQILLKSQQVTPGARVVLSGSHPLLFILADQLLNAGVEIAAICLPQSWKSVLDVLISPQVMLEQVGKLSAVGKILLRLKRRNIPLHFNAAVVKAHGEDRLDAVDISSLTVDGVPTGVARRVECDGLAIGYGFLASSELARQAGAHATWDGPRGGWLVTVDEWQRTSLPGVYAAGEITAVEGSDVALAEGFLAGVAAATSMGLHGAAQPEIQAARSALAKGRRFAGLLTSLSAPPAALLRHLRAGDTILCRCEDVTTRQMEDALAANDFIRTPSALKLMTRAGMGPCQGRMCGHAVMEVMRDANALETPMDISGFTPRAPIKPFGLWHKLD